MMSGAVRVVPRLVGIVVSAALLGALYWSVDPGSVLDALRSATGTWLFVSIGLIVPLTLLRALRLLVAAPRASVGGMAEALRLTLAAAALNLLMPAKSGDLLKSYFIRSRGQATTGVAVSVVVYERLADVFSLLALSSVAGLLVYRDLPAVVTAALPALVVLVIVAGGFLVSARVAQLAPAVAATLLPGSRLRGIRNLAVGWPDLVRSLGDRRGSLLVISLTMWLGSLVQVWLFAKAVGVPVPFLVCAPLSAIALLAGQVPFTFGGLGPRDLVLVAMLGPFGAPEAASAIGVLTSTRVLLPAAAGLLFVRQYVSRALGDTNSAGAPPFTAKP